MQILKYTVPIYFFRSQFEMSNGNELGSPRSFAEFDERPSLSKNSAPRGSLSSIFSLNENSSWDFAITKSKSESKGLIDESDKISETDSASKSNNSGDTSSSSKTPKSSYISEHTADAESLGRGKPDIDPDQNAASR